MDLYRLKFCNRFLISAINQSTKKSVNVGTKCLQTKHAYMYSYISNNIYKVLRLETEFIVIIHKGKYRKSPELESHYQHLKPRRNTKTKAILHERITLKAEKNIILAYIMECSSFKATTTPTPDITVSIPREKKTTSQ